jgi:hypothetical protein
MSTYQTSAPRGVTFRPDSQPEMLRRSFARASHAMVLTQGDTDKAVALVKDDIGAMKFLLQTRGAVTPSSTSAPTNFTQTTINTLAAVMPAACAFNAVRERATVLEFGRAGAVWCHGMSADATSVNFVPEASVSSVLKWDTSSGRSLSPMKLSWGIVVTDELAEYSNLIELGMRKLGADLQIGIETEFFSETQPTSVRPGGILYGINAESTSSGFDTKDHAAVDLAAIAGKVTAGG